MTIIAMRSLKEEKNVGLWSRTTLRVGGIADAVVHPESGEEIAAWMAGGEVSLILGGGSNLLVSDEGIRGVTMSLDRGFKNVETERRGDEIIVRAGAGVSLTALAGMMMKTSASGLEFAYGIPGTLGGALIMNAGARDGEMKDVVESVSAVTRGGAMIVIPNRECGFSYRSSSFPEGAVITGAALRLRAGAREKINALMRKNQIERKRTQPLDMPSAGSVFRNPPGDWAGRLIEAAGLKGLAIGGAMVSEKHANFIVNRGGAMAADVYRLIRLAEDRVYETSGVRLDREVRLAGRFEE